MDAKKRKGKFRKLLKRIIAVIITIALMASSLGCDKNTRARRNDNRRVRAERVD